MIANVSLWSVLLPCAAAWAAFKTGDSGIRLLTYFFSLATVTELTSKALAMRATNNFPVYNLYFLIELPAWLFVFCRWTTSATFHVASALMAGLYVVAWSYEMWWGLGWLRSSDALGVLRAVVLTFAAGSTLLRLSHKVEEGFFTNAKLWIAFGVLVYFSINAVLFSLMTAILKRTDTALVNVWIVHSFLNIFANILFTIGLLCNFRKTNFSLPLGRSL